jgi:hypothetical protein
MTGGLNVNPSSADAPSTACGIMRARAVPRGAAHCRVVNRHRGKAPVSLTVSYRVFLKTARAKHRGSPQANCVHKRASPRAYAHAASGVRRCRLNFRKGYPLDSNKPIHAL